MEPCSRRGAEQLPLLPDRGHHAYAMGRGSLPTTPLVSLLPSFSHTKEAGIMVRWIGGRPSLHSFSCTLSYQNADLHHVAQLALVGEAMDLLTYRAYREIQPVRRLR